MNKPNDREKHLRPSHYYNLSRYHASIGKYELARMYIAFAYFITNQTRLPQGGGKFVLAR